jgi:hypothetical protein
VFAADAGGIASVSHGKTNELNSGVANWQTQP